MKSDRPAPTVRTYLTVRELAAQLQIKADTVRDLIRRGELRAVNVARNPNGRPRWRIPPEAVAEFEATRAPKPAEPRRKRRRRSDGVLDLIR
ncbi:Helix-turn-helix domain protein [Maioricimonas rarisocia]|uniref:Helix-turn-helix domain protein n=1 Tax=Maioricimonas rarisocia TaxID=2528026 RepID=A0A517Z5C5_9PLAN|nr:Helix-turn-helix domain protein [Maioricimonas rarisocia]